MPTLRQQLAQRDPIELHIIAQNQGLLLEPAGRDLLTTLVEQMLQPAQVQAVWDDLDAEARRALAHLARLPQGMPAPTFQRHYGELRRIGPGRLPTEQPWKQPTGPAETLWYLGWLTRGFRKRTEGVIDVVALPDDLTPLLPAEALAWEESTPTALAPAPAGVHCRALGALLLDDLGTLLAYVQNHPVWLKRQGRWPVRDWQQLLPRLRLSSLREQPLEVGGPLHLLIWSARKLGLLVERQRRQRFGKALRPWLEMSRAAQLDSLFQAWRQAEDWNDLCLVSGLKCQPGAWRNDPLLARTTLLQMLAQAEPEVCFQLEALVQALYQQNPDFQRPDGLYDTWYIQDAAGQDLRGFEHWREVEGRLIQGIWQGPLFWLGVVAMDETGAFWHLTSAGAAMLRGEPVDDVPDAPVLHVQEDFQIVLAPHIGLWDRLRVARFAFWLASEPEFRYQINRRGMLRARKHGISGAQIVDFLQRASHHQVPPRVQRTLESFR